MTHFVSSQYEHCGDPSANWRKRLYSKQDVLYLREYYLRVCINTARVTAFLLFSPSASRCSPPLFHPAMLPCVRRVLRPVLSLRAGTGLARAGLGIHHTPAAASPGPLSTLVQRCNLGTHPPKEPVEPLDSPRGAKEFIYSLHPSERTCLLRELHKFESIAIAQGRWCATVRPAKVKKCTS